MSHPTLHTTDITPFLTQYLPPKLSKFITENASRSEGNFIRLAEMFPIENVKTATRQINVPVPDSDQMETRTIVSIAPPDDIPEEMKPFWIGDLQYVDVHNRAKEFQQVVRTNPKLFPILATFAQSLYERNYILHAYYYLKLFVMNISPQYVDATGRAYSARWGLLTSHLLIFLDMRQNNEYPFHEKPFILFEIEALRNELDRNPEFLGPFKTVEHRTWLMHYALCMYFRWNLHGKWTVFDICLGHSPQQQQQDKRDDREDRKNAERYAPVLQMKAPHLVPYLLAACIIHKKRHTQLSSLLRVMEAIQPASSIRNAEPTHPVVDFVQALYVNFDFEAAFKAIEDARPLLEKDYFLRVHADKYINNAKALIATHYIKVHSRISTASFATKFGIEKGQVHAWLNENVQGYNLDGVEIGDEFITVQQSTPSVYQMALQRGDRLAGRQHKVRQLLEQRD